MTSGRAVRGIDGDAAADDPRHTGAQLRVRRLLLLAEEHVAVVHHTFRRKDRQCAQTAFTAPTVEDHIDTRGFHGLEHGLADRHIELATEPGNLHLERLGGETAAVAEGLEAQLIDRTTAVCPMPLRGLDQADWTADIELSAGSGEGG